MTVSAKSARGRIGHLPRRRRLTIYVVSIGVWITGAVWLLFHYFVREVDKFGFENAHPAEKWWLIGHAAFALMAVWLFGVLWPGHVKKSWHQKIRRGTGGALFGVTAWLTLTGLALYYIGSDAWRSWTSILHWTVGLAGLGVFAFHLLTRTPRSAKQQ